MAIEKRGLKPAMASWNMNVPRPERQFNPMVVPERESMVEGADCFLFDKGMSVADIEDQLKRDGYEEILGMWLDRNECDAYWMSVSTDMKARGLPDILITEIGNLNDFTLTIRSIFSDLAT